MARVEINETVNQTALLPFRGLKAGSGIKVQVNVRNGAAATVYAAATGGSTLTNPLTTDSAGRIEGWLEEGSYDLVISPGSLNGIAEYTQRFEAVAGASVVSVESGSVGRRVSVLDKGADRTGLTNSSQAFADAKAAAGAGPVYAPEGVYRLEGTPFTSGAWSLDGDGPGRTIIDMIGVPLSTIAGSLGVAKLLTASVTLGATTLTMSDTSGLAAGDYLILRDVAQVLSGTSSSPYAGVVGEVVRVKSVDSSTVITIWGAVEQAMPLTAGNLSLRKMNLLDGVTLDGVTLRNPNPGTYIGGTARGLDIDFCKNVRIRNVDTQGLDDDSFNLGSCVDWSVTNCNGRDSTNTGGRTPYFVVANNACVNGLVHGCRQTGGRHLFTTGGDDGEIGPAHIRISECIAWHSTTNPFDSHPAGRHIVFSGCQAHACVGGGFHVRSPKSRVEFAYVVGTAAAAGITLGGSATGSSVCHGEVWGVTTGVDVQANDCDVHHMKVEGSSYGVRVRANVDNNAPAIDKARVRDINVVGNPSVAGVAINGTETATKWFTRIVAPDATTPTVPASRSVSSATTVGLPVSDTAIDVAGATTIDNITVDLPGIYILRFASTPTVRDGVGNLDLAGNFVATAGDVLTISHNGVSASEIARSAN